MDKLYKILKFMLLFMLCIVIIIPFIIFILYLRKNNKTIKIHPKIKIVDVENSFNYNEEETKEAVRIGKEILEKLNIK